ncbi:MAG: hypothetical protein CL608_16760 [Anaerolineaceae bacterium]|nr:hypothetical protein [Anaerolineaceae bacterium]
MSRKTQIYYKLQLILIIVKQSRILVFREANALYNQLISAGCIIIAEIDLKMLTNVPNNC